jgi:hypothetical protein
MVIVPINRHASVIVTLSWVMPLHLYLEPKPMRTSEEYVHKDFDKGFVKDHIIST